MNKKLGVYIITSEFGCDEISTFTCGHCNTPHLIPHKSNPDDIGGTCSICWTMICPKCVGGGCDPFEKKLERAESRERTLRTYGI